MIVTVCVMVHALNVVEIGIAEIVVKDVKSK